MRLSAPGGSEWPLEEWRAPMVFPTRKQKWVAPCLSFHLGLGLLHKIVLLLEGLPLGKGQVMYGTDPVKVGPCVDCVKSVAGFSVTGMKSDLFDLGGCVLLTPVGLLGLVST